MKWSLKIGLIWIAAALSLSACNFPSIPDKPPAPLEATTIDEKALIVALESFDTALTTIDLLIDSGYIEPGSPKALRLADLIEDVQGWLEVASTAQRTGSASTYSEALENARKGISQIRALLKGDT